MKLLATAIITFKNRGNKKYKYEFETPKELTKSNLAIAIAIAKGKKEKVPKYTGLPKDYPLIMELLNNQRIVYTGKDEGIDYFKDASIRNYEERNNHVWNPVTKKFEVLVWRVGRTFSNRLVIDVDGKNVDNLKDVKEFYENLLNLKFRALETNKGFWLLSEKKYDSIEEWKFDHCRVLLPGLTKAGMNRFIQRLHNLDLDEFGQFRKATEQDIRAICNCHGDFDIYFNLLSIKREQSTLRVSKKRKDDKIQFADLKV